MLSAVDVSFVSFVFKRFMFVYLKRCIFFVVLFITKKVSLCVHSRQVCVFAYLIMCVYVSVSLIMYVYQYS